MTPDRRITRFTDDVIQLRYGSDRGILARYLYVRRDGPTSWAVYGARGPLGEPGSTFEWGGYRRRRDAIAAADGLAAEAFA